MPQWLGSEAQEDTASQDAGFIMDSVRNFNFMKLKLRQQMKGLVEKTTGVRISRMPIPDKHFYSDLARLRAWTPDDVIFDVGANDGRTVIRLKDALPIPRVYAFEPVSATYRELVSQTSRYPSVRCFQLALGARQGRQDIHLNAIAAMNSFLPDWSTAIGTESVGISTVDQVMIDNDVPLIHFLKIDTEGYDLEVLKGAQKALTENRIEVIQTEIRFDRPHVSEFQEMITFLTPFGYHLFGIYNQCRQPAERAETFNNEASSQPKWSVLTYADAVFVAARAEQSDRTPDSNQIAR
jgi:FkbM family methyltransferase